MTATIEYLALLRARHDTPTTPCTDYRLAKLLDISQSNLIRYLRHGGQMDDAVAMRMAHLLNLHPGIVLMRVAEDRAANSGQADVASAWGGLQALLNTMMVRSCELARLRNDDLPVPIRATATNGKTPAGRARVPIVKKWVVSDSN